MTPTEQDEELREKLKEAVLETGRYETIGDEQLEDKYLGRFIDELVLHAKAYTDKRVREARLDSLLTAKRRIYETDVFELGLALGIIDSELKKLGWTPGELKAQQEEV